MILRLAALFLTWLALSTNASAQAPQRFALTIGNEDYSGALTPLNRPHEDGDRLGGALKAAGFSVRPTEDQSRSDIIREVSALAERLRAAGPEAIGFFYYSGHGASALVGGRRQNFLIPARSSISRAQELVADGVPLDTIIALLEQTGAKAVFIVFDACRTELPWSKGGADPDKAFNTVSARPGMFIAYSTAEGASAPDDGAFAAALAEQLVRPDRPHLNAFDAAARSVGRTRGTDRLPWYSNQIADDIYFVTRPQMSTPAPPRAQPLQQVAPAASVAPSASSLDARTTPATTPAPERTSPDWARLPSAEDMARYYPERAQRMEISGQATIACVVLATGDLSDCSIVSESPPDMGFGDATLRASRLFKMKPATLLGQPVDGGKVRIPITWKLP